MTYLSDELIKLLKDMETKKSGSISHVKIQKKVIKQMKKEQWNRVHNAKRYSLSLSKIFKNKLLNFISS